MNPRFAGAQTPNPFGAHKVKRKKPFGAVPGVLLGLAFPVSGAVSKSAPQLWAMGGQTAGFDGMYSEPQKVGTWL